MTVWLRNLAAACFNRATDYERAAPDLHPNNHESGKVIEDRSG